MNVTQAVFGVFHHFELAHQLHRRGHLRKIFSTWPWSRLQREGLPHNKVRTFPWLHVPEYLLDRLPLGLTSLTDELGYRAVDDVVHVRDLHATMLYLCGIDHRRLSVKYQGLDIRLTGVEGARVIKSILA